MPRCSLLVVVCCLAPLVTLAEPLPIADQNPLLSGFGFASNPPARVNSPGEWTLDSVFSWGNSAVVQNSSREALIVDAETRELRTSLARGFQSGWTLRLQLPFRETTAGNLDGFIDDWHNTFGLPEGARPTLPEDALRLSYRRDGRTGVARSTSARGLGDIAIDVGKQLRQTDRSAVAGWLSINLPTGEVDDFTGSGGVDITASLSAQHELSERWEVFGHVSGIWLGNSDRLEALQREFAWSAGAGISAQALTSLEITLQLDAHSSVFDSELDFLGDALLLSVGGTYSFANDWQLSAAVTEDIDVETSPDVVFVISLKTVF